MDLTKYKGDGGIEDLVRARLSEDWPALTESSLNRVAHHVEDGHFGIVTSWKGGKHGMSRENPSQIRKYDKNQEDFQGLRKSINKDGFGYVRMIGYGALEKGATNQYREHSVIIPGKGRTTPLTQGKVADYAKRYKQESYIYAGPETNHEVHLIDTHTGTSLHHFGKFESGKLGDYHSRLLGGKDKSRNAKETGSEKAAFAFEDEQEECGECGLNGPEPAIIAWEYLPEQSVSYMRARSVTEIKIACELGIDLTTTRARIDEALGVSSADVYDDSEITESQIGTWEQCVK